MARTPPDGCIVPTAPLSELVRDFLGRWNRDHPQDEEWHIRGVAWLSATAGVPEPTICNVVLSKYRTTELRVADALATALGHLDVFGYPGDDPPPLLPILPNRSAPASAREECCGKVPAVA